MLPSLKTRLASLLESGCAVEDGEYGPRLVPAGEWSERHAKFLTSHGLKEIHFNRERGFSSRGDYGFLERLPVSLVGMKFVDSDATNLTSCLTHSEGLRSLDLTFVGKQRETLALERLPMLERVSILVPLAGAETLFQCARLERLALSRYSRPLSRVQFGNLKSLKSLFLSAVQLADLTPLQDLSALESLTVAAAKGLQSLAGIEGMQHLKSLTIESSRGLGSLKPIEGLVAIKRLWLYNCGRIESLKPVERLTGLCEVTLNGNTNVVDGDLSVLCGLPHLKTVCVVDRPHYRPRAVAVNRNG